MKHKSTNFPAIYYNILKHEWDLSATVLPWVLSSYSLTAFVPVDLPSLTTQVQHYLMATHANYLVTFLCIYVHFTPFFVLLYNFISPRMSFYSSTFLLWHLSPISYNVMVSFAFFVFVRHTVHCFLLVVSLMLDMVKKHCPEEAHLNRWAKRRQNNKIMARRSNWSAWQVCSLKTYSS